MLSDFQKGVLHSLGDGKVITQKGMATACRILEQAGMVVITADESRPQPYFACVPTAAGLEALNVG